MPTLTAVETPTPAVPVDEAGTQRDTTPAGGIRVRSVRTKILGVVAVLAVVTLVLATYAVMALRTAANDGEELVWMRTNVVAVLSDFEVGLAEAQLLVSEIEAMGRDSADLGAALADQAANDELMAGYVPALSQNLVALQGFSEGHAVNWAEVPGLWEQWRQVRDANLTYFMDKGHIPQTLKVESRALLDQIEPQLEDLTAQTTVIATDIADQTSSNTSRAVIIMIVAALLGVVLSVVIATLVANSVRRSVDGVRRSLLAMADGDLTVRAEVRTHDELGEMATALDEAQDKISGFLRSMSDGSHVLSAGTDSLATRAGQVAAGAEESATQAGVVASAGAQVSQNVQSVAAGAEQMGASIREIAQNANEAARV
ncbi:HAMP domain-containing protein, partial [Georgenia sp.]